VKIAERITNKNGRGTSWPASRLRDRLKSTTHPPQKMNFCRCPLSPHTIFSTNLRVQIFLFAPRMAQMCRDQQYAAVGYRRRQSAEMLWGQVSVLVVVACFAGVALLMMRGTPHP
jgi:hypothetical protein